MSDINLYWAAFFGIEPELLERPGTQVVRHKTLIGYAGAWLFHRKSTLILSVPEGDVAATQRAAGQILDHLRPPAVADAIALFGSRVERVLGPAYQGFITGSDFQAMPRSAVRRLTDAERPTLGHLAAALGPEEWEHASIDVEDEPIFVATRGPEIIAAANAKEEDGATVLGVASHPGYRGQGVGKAVVSAAVAFALSQDRPVRYQTLAANTGSLGIAAALGFQDYARTLAVRFCK